MYASLARSSGSVTTADAMYDVSVWITPMFEAFPTTEYVLLLLSPDYAVNNIARLIAYQNLLFPENLL